MIDAGSILSRRINYLLVISCLLVPYHYHYI